MSDGKEFKTPREKEAEAMAARIDECEKEIQGVLGKWRMRLAVIEIRQDARTVGLEIKAVPLEPGQKLDVGANGGD